MNNRRKNQPKQQNQNRRKRTEKRKADRKIAKMDRRIIKKLGIPAAKLEAWSKMIADPCTAVLEPGICGTTSGQLARPQKVGNFCGYQSQPYGYVLWFPSFSNDGNETAAVVSPSECNYLVWGAASPDTRPAASGYGAAGTANTLTVHSMIDPAYALASSNQVDDHRNLAACLKVKYIGQQSTCAGALIPLTNVPLELAILSQGSTAGIIPPTVSELLAYSQHAPVRPLDGIEVKWRPQSAQSALTYRGVGETPFNCGAGNPSLPSSSHETSPTGIGFVWYGLAATNLLLEAVKIVEYRTTPFSGLMAAEPRGSDNPGILATVISHLDAKYPNWQVTASSYGIQAVSNLMSNLALGGSTGAASRAAPLLLM